MLDGNTPATGTALSPDEGKTKLAALLSTPPKEQAEKPKQEDTPVHAEADTPEAGSEEATSSEARAEDGADNPDTNAPEAESEPAKFRLADGTEVTADEVEEWRRGNLRQSDYTRKAQKLAEDRKAADDRNAQIAQQAQYFDQVMPLILQWEHSAIPPMPSPEMKETDWIGYHDAKDAHEMAVRKFQDLQQAAIQRQQQIRQEQDRMHHEQVERASAEMLRMMPELKDPAKVQALTAEIETALPTFGYTAADAQYLNDPRQVVILKKAIAYDKLMAAKPKAIDKAKDAAPVQQPGRRPSASEANAKARQEQMAKLRKTGDRNVGQALIRQMLERGG